MNPLEIFRRLYDPDSRAYGILVDHGRRVAEKALAAAGQVAPLEPDRQFIEEAAILHDIGAGRTHAPVIDCHGPLPYVCHGVEGRKILDDLGYPRHALVCERHVGAGLTADEIRRRGLPLPHRDMRPVSLEEQLICYADKFFSKHNPDDVREKPVARIVQTLEKYGDRQAAQFMAWHRRFSTPA